MTMEARLRNAVDAKYFYMRLSVLLMYSTYLVGTLFISQIFSRLENDNNINNNNNTILPSTFWTDQAIAYWSNFDPVPPLSTNSSSDEIKRYTNEVNLKLEAQLRRLKCVPKEGVFEAENLNIHNLLPPFLHLVPNQKIVLKRCFPQYSFCETFGMKCLPTKFKKKNVTVFLQNNNNKENTHGGAATAVVFKVPMEEHSDCVCQCPLIKTDST